MYNLIKKEIELADGRTITIETGKLAKQADGSVVVRLGNTMLLAAVTSARDARDDVDFMPLSVDYKEKFAAAGRFPGGFLKREARPSDYEILIARLVDRALRPLFPDNYHAETFVTINLISADAEVKPDALAGLAASAALAVSDIPFNGPISECRVARINGEFIVNPKTSDLAEADLDMLVGATIDNIMMVEGEMDEVSEDVMLEAIKVAHEAIKPQCQAQLDLMEMVGTTVKREYCHEQNDEELKQLIHDKTYQKTYEVAQKQNPNKHERAADFNAIIDAFVEEYKEGKEDEEVNNSLIHRYYHDVHKEAVRRLILDEGARLDGRKTNNIRPIWCETDYLPSAHGSAVFTRGETQSLTTVTLGSKLDEKIIDDVMERGTDRFLLHYNFPPYSTGDARPYRGTSRREVGHGNLAHRALKKMIPTDGDLNPYVIRIVSDILESNGSSSMATVCAGTLALMDTGVKIKKPVSGIAMGLISEKGGSNYAVLSDILGDEDHLGDMDFKVTGTRDGITATQMDIKVDGLSYEILSNALNQAKEGRLHILDVMNETISAPREDYKEHVPKMKRFSIPKEMIGAVIGPGGKIIQEIQAATNTVITIEEIDSLGYVSISGVDPQDMSDAFSRINRIVEVPVAGKTYKGIVKSIVAFGAFIEVLPGKEGLLHISEIDWKRLNTVEEALKEGQEIEVKLIEVDKKSGKFKLSRKALLPKPEGMSNDSGNRPNRDRNDRNDRGGDRNNRRDRNDRDDRRRDK